MQANDVKRIIEEHKHLGTDTKRIRYDMIKERPSPIITAPTADLDLAGFNIIGKTLITAQTEKTSLADDDKFIIGDSSDGEALKYIKRNNLGHIYITPSTSIRYSDVSSSTSSKTFTVPFSGIFRLTYSLRQTDSGGGNYGAELNVRENCKNTYRQAETIDGTIISHSGTGADSYTDDVITYEGTQFMLELSSNTTVYNFYIRYSLAISDGIIAN